MVAMVKSVVFFFALFATSAFLPTVDAGLRGAYMRSSMQQEAAGVPSASEAAEEVAAEATMTKLEQDQDDEEDEEKTEKSEAADDDDETDGEQEQDDNDEDNEDDEDEKPGTEELAAIKKAGILADQDGDARLSVDEMMKFAEAIRDRQRTGNADSTFQVKDANKDGFLSLEEITDKTEWNSHYDPKLLEAYAQEKFTAADVNRDTQLDREEYKAYLHPETNQAVLEVEASFQFQVMDKDANKVISMEEYLEASKLGDEADFSHADTKTDFETHDLNQDGTLDKTEFADLVKGHVLTRSHIERVVREADDDGDGYLHMHDEIPQHMEEILDNEFIEDYFLVDHHAHEEL